MLFPKLLGVHLVKSELLVFLVSIFQLQSLQVCSTTLKKAPSVSSLDTMLVVSLAFYRALNLWPCCIVTLTSNLSLGNSLTSPDNKSLFLQLADSRVQQLRKNPSIKECSILLLFLKLFNHRFNFSIFILLVCS